MKKAISMGFSHKDFKKRNRKACCQCEKETNLKFQGEYLCYKCLGDVENEKKTRLRGDGQRPTT